MSWNRAFILLFFLTPWVTFSHPYLSWAHPKHRQSSATESHSGLRGFLTSAQTAGDFSCKMPLFFFYNSQKSLGLGIAEGSWEPNSRLVRTHGSWSCSIHLCTSAALVRREGSIPAARHHVHLMALESAHFPVSQGRDVIYVMYLQPLSWEAQQTGTAQPQMGHTHNQALWPKTPEVSKWWSYSVQHCRCK